MTIRGKELTWLKSLFLNLAALFRPLIVMRWRSERFAAACAV